MSLRDTCLLIFSSTLLLAIQKMWKVAKFLHIFNISLLTISQSANRYFEKTCFKVLPTQIFSNSIYSNSLYSADSHCSRAITHSGSFSQYIRKYLKRQHKVKRKIAKRNHGNCKLKIENTKSA